MKAISNLMIPFVFSFFLRCEVISMLWLQLCLKLPK